MKKIFILFLGILTVSLISAQSPQQINYQAIVRDSSGTILQNQNIALRINILQSNATGTSVYAEEHYVTTNQFGLINIKIGNGTVINGSFSGIEWGNDIYFIKLEIDETGGNNYSLMGVSQLLSVPYALYSEKAGNGTLWEQGANGIYYNNGNVGVGTIMPNGKLQVSSDTIAGINDVIFSVLNAHGDTVFAVYQEGVRIWVSDDTTGVKANGNRGGFAVGGYNPTKATTDEYLRVTPDSVRIYIKETTVAPTSGSRGGFAVGGLNPTKTPTDYYFNIEHNDFPEIINGKARILWYPFREAFRAGLVLITSADSVGINSFATGYKSKAIGNYSQSFGYETRAFGNNSTAIGFHSEALGVNSFAFGDSAIAIGINSLAFGSSLRNFIYYDDIAEAYDTLNAPGPIAQGNNALAIGYGSRAIGDASIAMGAQDTTFKPFSVAIGKECKAIDMYSSVFGGYKNSAGGWFSFIGGGQQNVTSGNVSSVVGGFYNYSTGYASTITGGMQNSSNGQSSCVAGGDFNTVNNMLSFIGGGHFNYVGADNSGIICGNFDTISGYSAIIIGGDNNTATGNFSMLLGGRYNEAHDYNEIVAGQYATIGTGSQNFWNTNDRLFVIGNGVSSIARHDALRILKNGEVYMPDVYSDIVGVTNLPLYIDNTGKLGYISSSKRYKKKIQDMENVEWIYKLRPVNYLYKNDKTATKQYGLIAEEVEKINPLFVSYNKSGKVETVKYTQLISPLIQIIKKQKEKIDYLENKTLQYENELQSLNNRIAEIENLLNRSSRK